MFRKKISQNFNILYIYQPNIYLLIILKIFIFKKKMFYCLHQIPLMNFSQQAKKRDVVNLILQIYLYFRQDQILLAKPNLLLERKRLNVKVLFIIIKVRNMKKSFNMVSAKAHSLTYTSTFIAPVNQV